MLEREKTILVTGAAGFIGSYMLGFLNRKGYENIIIADDFSREDKKSNYETKKFIDKIERAHLFDWLKENNPAINFVIHLGARTDTAEFDYSIHEKLNVEYSKNIWHFCTKKNIPLVYASSAATYGAGEWGYKDEHEITGQLQPLNPYGISKNEFDKWALMSGPETAPPFWSGLKFFNVYGPNEYHKGRMASMIFHGFNQVQKSGKVKLFKSHKPGYKDGEQLRDFIYVEDVAKVMYWMMNEIGSTKSEAGSQTSDIRPLTSGLYNLGTGKARTFKDLIHAIFTTLNLPSTIEYIDMPDDIRDNYQYFTEADMNKLKNAGYDYEFFSLEEGVKDYVQHFLIPGKYY